MFHICLCLSHTHAHRQTHSRDMRPAFYHSERLWEEPIIQEQRKTAQQWDAADVTTPQGFLFFWEGPKKAVGYGPAGNPGKKFFFNEVTNNCSCAFREG